MTTKLNLKSSAATANRPTNLRVGVNDCKSIVYKTSNSLKTKTKRAFALLLMLALLAPAAAWAQSTFGGGSGTINDPYKMYNPGHFVQLADEVNAGNSFEGVYFKLTSSVDFQLYGQIPPIGGKYYTENDATGIRRFCGQFLGNNHTLYNLTITENPDQCGLFGCLGYGGLVMDLTIDGNSTITGIGDCGAIVGSAEINTNIINCTVGENVVVKVHPDAAGFSYFPGDFGGIVGSTSGRISSCVSKASISNSGINKATNLGGIAGSVSNAGQVENCYFLGSVEGTNTVGDIAGDNYGAISQCYYHTDNRHGAINGADTDGAMWMGTVTMASGVSGVLPQATYTNSNTLYFAAGKVMLLTLNYSAPDGYILQDNQVSYMANDVAIGETEQAGQPYYEFTMPAEDVTISAVVDLKRDIAYTPWVQIYIPSLTYTGEPLSPEAQVIDIKDGTQQQLTEGEHFTVTWPDEIINAGEYTATINGIGDWAGSTSVTFSVGPAGSVARIVTHPTAIEGLTYNGHAQVLITAGEVEGGVMLYRLENGEYSTELPTAISVGTYTVYYKAHSDDNHLDSSELSLVAQISQATGMWEGEGTAEAPYLIKSVMDMNLIALKMEEMGDYAGVYFSLENDLDYTNAEQLPIGTLQRRFNGTFDGNGHTFTNMVINRPDDTYVAIFAVVDDNAVISDLHLGEGCAITGGTCVGGIAGLFSGAISDCTTAPGVTVSATYQQAGGIVGRCAGTIERCVNQASVSANNREAGGIAGSAYNSSSRISSNLNLGSVTANSYVGGIIGYYLGVFLPTQSPFVNNYYAGNCNTGAINGHDRVGQAMYGYRITGVSPVEVSLPEGATVGVAYEDNVYAGYEQSVVMNLDIPNPSITQQCYTLSAGTLEDNGDGTYTITMPEENITVSGNIVKYESFYYQLDCGGNNTAMVVQHDSYATMEWAVVPYSITHGESTYYVTGIGDKAFEGCTALELVSLHDEITTIGSEAFKNCSSIVQISTQAAMPPVAGQDAFLGVPENASIVGMPFCYQYDYSVAPEWNRFSNFGGTGPCDYDFTGRVSTSWSDPQNWMEGVVPDGNSRVAVRGTCEIDEDVTVGSITLGCHIDEEYGLYDRLIVKSGKTLTANNFIWTTGDATHFIIEDGAQVVQPNADAKATVEKNITAYTPNTIDGYHLIGHSFADNGAVSEMDNLLANDYDLYYYDEPTHYWMNQKQTANDFTELEAAKGYLYANSASQTIGLKGTLNAANAMVNIPLSYEADALKGFNLVGNPFAHNVTTFTGTNVATEVYRMNGTKDNLMVSTISASDPLTPGEGFFVKATGDGASITFNAQTRGGAKATELAEVPTITLNLTQNGLLVDRFILKRDGEPLEKFTLNENATRIYTTHGGKDYAVATVGDVCRDVARNVSVGRDAKFCVSTEVPLHFKAAKNGTYTLTFDTQNLDLEYLHLIDNLTGNDVDLLTLAGFPLYKGGQGGLNQPSYTFTAKTTDYASRFRLVFSEPVDETSANRPFAFIADGEIRINEADAHGASLQVTDVMGRVIVTKDVARNVSTNGMTSGVYVLRLINGDNVRTQKIVID